MKSSKEEEEFLRLLAEVRILEGGAREIETRLNIIDVTLNELRVSSETLKGIKGKEKNSQLFVPIGGGSFVKANIEDVEKVVVGVGAGVAIEKKIDDALESTRGRIVELEKFRSELERQLIGILNKIEEDKASINELSKKLREKGLVQPSKESR